MTTAYAVAEGPDTINLVEVGQAIRRGWRPLIVCTLLGIVAAAGVLTFASRRFASSASVLVRASPGTGGASSMLAKLGLGDAVPGVGASSPIETEVAILSSRALVSTVVDSLKLQADVTSPRSVAARDVISTMRLASAFKHAKYEVVRSANGQYQFTQGDKKITAVAGAPVALAEGTVVLRADTTLPPRFDLVLLDREDAIAAAQQRLAVSKTTGSDVINIGFQASDSSTSAAFANLLIANYLVRRHTVDRGTNEYRAAFLAAQVDTISRQLRLAEDSLRRFQERTGVLQPELQGKLQLDEASAIRTQLASVDIERGAITQLTSQIAAGAMTPRQLAAYPAFLKSPAINALLTQLVQVETDRTQLLERRLENDRQVVALTQNSKDIEGQIGKLATSYKSTLDRQRVDLTSQLDTVSRALSTFPGAVESSGRLVRHAKELAQTYAVLQAQLVDARLASIGEGGDVHQLDVATPPKKVIFPRPLMTMGIGTGAGFFVGLILALFSGVLGRYVEDPQAIERTTGVPALRFDESVPLLLSGNPVPRTLLLLPIDGRVSTAGVAERLARTALARGTEPTVLDLSGTGPSASTALTTDVNATMRRLERDHGMVIVRLRALAADETAAALTPERVVLLVAPSGRLERRMLVDAMQTLRRLDVPVAGVVVNRMSDAARG